MFCGTAEHVCGGFICRLWLMRTGFTAPVFKLKFKHKKKRNKEDKINLYVMLLDVIHQQQPGHDLLLKSVIQLR